MFAVSVNESGQSRLYVMNADGTHVRVAADSLALRGAPAWAPDRRSLLVTAADETGTPCVHGVSLDGSAPTRIVSEYSVDPVWAPDGSFIVYSGPDIGTTFQVKAATPEGRPYHFPNLVLTRGARHFAFFARDPHALIVLKGEMGHNDVSLIDLETGSERPLTNFGRDIVVRDFDISPDGRELVVEQGAGALGHRADRFDDSMKTSRLFAALLVTATAASAQSSGHFDLDVRKSGFLRPGKSHIDPVSAWVTHTDEFSRRADDGAQDSDVHVAHRRRGASSGSTKNDEDNREVSRAGSATFVLFLDRPESHHARRTSRTSSRARPLVRSVAITADVIAKLFGDYHYADGRLRLKSKGAYATGADSPDETLSLAWDVSLDAPVVEHHR